MIRRPPRSTQGVSSAASDVYKRPTFDIPDENLLKFAQLAIGLFGPSLGGIIATLELPSVPLPELAFDLDADGEADVLLEIRDATFAPVDTTSDGVADWICILSDLRSASQ